MFQSLGFATHPEKSKFIPSKKVEYLGFVIDSRRMVTYLSDHKKEKIYDKCQSISKKQYLKVRNVPSFIGSLNSTFLVNEYGPLYYRAILKNKDDFPKANKVIYTDASLEGWERLMAILPQVEHGFPMKNNYI